MVSSWIMFGALALVPLLLMVTTSYVKISVVFSMLRNALGIGQVPSGTIIAALSILLSLYVMAPVGDAMMDAVQGTVTDIDQEDPFAGPSFDAVVATFDLGKEPLRNFMARNSGEDEQAMFLDLARDARPEDTRDQVAAEDFLVLMPSFLITELAEAFLIGFLLFIPFIVLDLVVANILMALGMHMMSPTTVSLPFKLLLFVSVDGWTLLSRALVLGYA
jgi:type III secretion protein R